MSSEYRIQYFSNNRKCWINNESSSLPSLDSAVSHLKHCVSSDPQMQHRLVKIDTVALSVNGETLIGSIS